MTRSLALVAAALLVVIACTSTDEEAETPGPGRLVIVDGGGDIVVLDPDGENRIALTDDARDSALYSQPIWSPDASSVAWGQVDEDGFAVGYQMVDDDDDRARVATGSLPIYLYWSPDSSNIALLHPGEEGLDFEVVDVVDEAGSTLDRGSPFYFSWSPDSSELIAHVGADGFQTITPSGTLEQAGSTAPGYLAPQWTGAGIFHVDDDGLVLDDGEDSLVAEVGEFTTFVANRQGTRVAMQSTGGAPAITASLVEVAVVPSDVVVVVDVATGETEVVTQSPALGYFWSPDGDSLLIMTPTGNGMQATVWGADGQSVDYAEFRPSIVLIREMFPFFPQYAQSLNYWSPDSTAFAYASDEGIFIQRLGETEPTKLSDGDWVAWSS